MLLALRCCVVGLENIVVSLNGSPLPPESPPYHECRVFIRNSPSQLAFIHLGRFSSRNWAHSQVKWPLTHTESVP